MPKEALFVDSACVILCGRLMLVVEWYGSEMCELRVENNPDLEY